MAKKENCEQLQEEKPLEEMFAELDLLAEKLENRDTSLEDSFILYRQGMELLKLCSGKLDTVEKKMLQLKEDGTFSEFSRGISKENGRNRESDQKLSACRGGIRRNNGSGYELQYAGRRQAPSANVDPGDISPV